FFVGQVADHINKGPGWDGQPAFLLNFGTNPSADAEFKVGGGKTQSAIVGFDQDIGQDSECAAGRDRTRNGADTVGELLLMDDGFHGTSEKNGNLYWLSIPLSACFFQK